MRTFYTLYFFSSIQILAPSANKDCSFIEHVKSFRNKFDERFRLLAPQISSFPLTRFDPSFSVCALAGLHVFDLFLIPAQERDILIGPAISCKFENLEILLATVVETEKSLLAWMFAYRQDSFDKFVKDLNNSFISRDWNSVEKLCLPYFCMNEEEKHTLRNPSPINRITADSILSKILQGIKNAADQEEIFNFLTIHNQERLVTASNFLKNVNSTENFLTFLIKEDRLFENFSKERVFFVPSESFATFSTNPCLPYIHLSDGRYFIRHNLTDISWIHKFWLNYPQHPKMDPNQEKLLAPIEVFNAKYRELASAFDSVKENFSKISQIFYTISDPGIRNKLSETTLLLINKIDGLFEEINRLKVLVSEPLAKLQKDTKKIEAREIMKQALEPLDQKITLLLEEMVPYKNIRSIEALISEIDSYTSFKELFAHISKIKLLCSETELINFGIVYFEKYFKILCDLIFITTRSANFENLKSEIEIFSRSPLYKVFFGEYTKILQNWNILFQKSESIRRYLESVISADCDEKILRPRGIDHAKFFTNDFATPVLELLRLITNQEKIAQISNSLASIAENASPDSVIFVSTFELIKIESEILKSHETSDAIVNFNLIQRLVLKALYNANPEIMAWLNFVDSNS